MSYTPRFVDYVDHSASSSLFDASYTYSFDKYSCVRGFYFAHVAFSYIIFLSGIFCFITRALPARFKPLHSWLGRVYILSMLWSTATSLLINNTGLPLATLVAFAAVLIGLTIAWLAILIYKEAMTRAATALVEQRIVKEGFPTDSSLGAMIADARFSIASKKTFVQRFFSLKALHGSLFFVSWFNIAGRIFASNQSGDFTCHTYPAYKPIDTKEHAGARGNLTLVPETDPKYSRLPWASGVGRWGLLTILATFAFAILFGAVWSYVAARKARTSQEDEKQVDLAADA